MKELLERIEARTAKIAVIGLGYVGLAVASSFARAGFRVTGVDKKAERVATINQGKCPIEGIEPALPELLAEVITSGLLSARADFAEVGAADVVLLGVDTPVASDKRARFTSLRAAAREVGRVMKPGALVIVESTVSPGTCDGVVADILAAASGRKKNEGFFLGHCPERVMPGKLLLNIANLPRACGGSTPDTAEAMVALYRTIVRGRLTACDVVTAEVVKTGENTWRDVNIAFANELALVCEEADADFREVRDLINQLGDRTVLVAGPGVGGHCIPKDPWLLVQAVRSFEPRLVRAARAANDGMPLHVARLVEDACEEAGMPLPGATVTLLGYAYRENTDDARLTPSAGVAHHLRDWGANVRIHDPFVREPGVDITTDLWKSLDGADAAVLMCAHRPYEGLDLGRLAQTMRTPVLVDGRHLVEGAAARAAGLVFRGLGRGKRR